MWQPGWEGSLGENGYIYVYELPRRSAGKESACNAGDLGLISGLGRSPEGQHDNPLQDSCLKNPHGQRSLMGYSPWGHREPDMTEQLSTSPSQEVHKIFKEDLTFG